MAKARYTFKIDVVCELNPDAYPGDMTPDEMVAYDVANMDDPFLVIDADSAEWDISGEIIDEGND